MYPCLVCRLRQRGAGSIAHARAARPGHRRHRQRLRADLRLPRSGAAIARDLRTRRERGEYDSIGASRALAEALNRHIDAIAHDKYTEVVYLEDDQLAEPPPADPATVRKQAAARRAAARAKHYDFAAPQRLDGNIALVRFDSFYPPVDAAPSSTA